MLDDRIRRIGELLEEQRETLLDLAAAMTAVPSVTGEEAAVATFVEGWLIEHGFETDRHYSTDDDLRRWPVYGGERDLADRPTIIGRLRSAAPTTGPVALNGHLDVVPVGDDPWRHAPFSGRREGGRIHGRGVADMKAGIAAAMIAMATIRNAGIELPFDVELQAVIAEESGGLGTLSLLEARGADYSAAMVFEPSSCLVVAACGGATPFTVEVDGRAAHISIPWTGASAFDALMQVYDGLRALEADREARLAHPLFDRLPQKAALAIGVVEAGDWRLSVPASARMLGRIGTLPFERLDDVRGEVAAAIDAVAAADGWLGIGAPRLSWDGAGFAGWETPESSPVVRAARAAALALGADPVPAAQTYGCDAGQFAARGVPVVVVGPGDLEQAHAVDESVAEDDVVLVAGIIAETLVRMGWEQE